MIEKTHSALDVGLLMFCRYGPFGAFGLLAGVLADRFDNRRLMIATQSSAMAVAGILTILAYDGQPQIATIFALGFLGGATTVFDAPTRHALTYQLVGRNEVANAVANTNYNVATKNRNTSTTSNSNSTSSSSRTAVEDLDLSNWVPDSSKYASIEYTDDELLVKNNDPKYYYVLAGTDKQKTVGADAVLTVRNVNNADTNLGYGLVFHSMTIPLMQGYAFVIDSKKKRYRVVHHSPTKEDAVVNWTRSDAIKDGTQPNTLEARDNGGTVDLYINDQKVNTIDNKFGYAEGVIGIYSSSSIPVAFSNMQLRR